MRWYIVGERKLSPFSWFLGGRGIGKTFSAIDFVLHPEEYGHPELAGGKFLYLRNTDKQIELSKKEKGNPFKKYNAKKGTLLKIEGKSDEIAEITNVITDEEGKEQKIQVGYAAGLSVVGNVRGIDFSDVKIIIFDEFNQRKKLTFNQFTEFYDFYETANRNREFEEPPEPPIYVLFLSNTQHLNNALLAGFNLITPIEQTIKAGQYTWRRYPHSVYLCDAPEIAEQKKKTVLYMATEGTKQYREAIDNEFANDSFFNIKKQNLNEYIGVTAIDGIYIYRHKHNGNLYCTTKSFTTDMLSSETHLALWRRNYMVSITDKFIRGRVFFENFQIKAKIMELCKITTT